MDLTPDVLERFGIAGGSPLPFIDDLTGLPNRRFLKRALDSLTGSGGGFSLLFMDLDNFKRVNDSAGHEEGDRLLRELGNVLKATLRKRDLVVRYGGDEFVIILSGDESHEAALVAEKVIGTVDSELGGEWGVSASIGISSHPEHASTAGDLLSMADNAMYSAKSSGRACWRVALPEGSSVYWHEDVLVCRAGEMDAAAGTLEPPDRNSLVLLTGETGSGKTSMLEILGGMLPDRNVICIDGRRELTSIPWAALALSIRRYHRKLPAFEIPPLWSRLLGRILPDVFGESDLSDSTMDRMALLDAFSRLMECWKPLLVTVDNSEFLDSETASMLAYALTSGTGSGLSVCASLAVEGGMTASPAEKILRSVGGHREISLQPLSFLQACELIRARLGVAGNVRELAESVHRFSGGNPLFACEYLRAMLNSGMLRVEQGKLQPMPGFPMVPDRIRSIVCDKLNYLSGDARRVLRHASVLRKEPIELDLLGAIAGREVGELLSILDEGLRSGFLRTAPGDMMSFRFTNEAFRREVYDSAGAALLKESHEAAAARRLEERDFFSAGHHLERSGRTAGALRAYRAGADASLRKGLPDAAVACLEKAELACLELEPSRRSREQLFEIVHGKLDACQSAGDWKRTRETAFQLAGLAEELGLEETVLSRRIMAADCLRMLGDYEEALEELEELEPRLDGRLLADCLIRMADSFSRMGRMDEAGGRLMRAEDLLSGDDESSTDLIRALLHQKLLLSIASEDIVSSVDISRRLLDMFGREQELAWFHLYDIAETFLLAGRPLRSVEVFLMGLEKARGNADLFGSLSIMAEMAEALYHSLDLDRAERTLDEVEELAGRFSRGNLLDEVLLIRTVMEMEFGRADSARDRMNDLLRRHPGNPVAAMVNSLMNEMEGNIEAALSEVRRALEILDGRGMGSLIHSSTVFTRDELLLQEAWTSACLEGSDWAGTAKAMIPGLGDRAAFRGTGLLSKWLHQTGRTEEAESVMVDALKRPEWSEMLLFRYRNLVIRSDWDISAAEEGRELMRSKKEALT